MEFSCLSGISGCNGAMSLFEMSPGWILKPALVTATRLGNGKSWIQFQEIYSAAGKIHWAGREKSILSAKEIYSGRKVGGWLEKLRAVAAGSPNLHQNGPSLPNLLQRKDSPLNAEEKQWLNLTTLEMWLREFVKVKIVTKWTFTSSNATKRNRTKILTFPQISPIIQTSQELQNCPFNILYCLHCLFCLLLSSSQKNRIAIL